MTSLADRAILVHFTSPMWEPKVQDTALAAQLERASSASAKTLRVYKVILRCDTLQSLRSIRSETYQKVHRKMTLPWVHAGPAILPITLYETYKEKLNAAKEREALIREQFYSQYPKLVEQSRVDMGSLYEPALYPTVDELRSKFDFRFTAQPLPATSDFRISDPDLASGYETVLEAAKMGALREAYTRLFNVVEHMANRLSIYEPAVEGERAKHPFHSSLVENVKEIAELMPSLNVTDDPKLTEMAKRALENLTYHDADSLREADSIRKNVLDEAKEILENLRGWK